MCQNFSGITRDTAVAQAGVRPPGNLVSSCMHCYTHSSCLGLFCKYRLLYSDSHLQIKSGSRSFPPACYLIPDFLHACLFFFHSLITLARFPGLGAESVRHMWMSACITDAHACTCVYWQTVRHWLVLLWRSKAELRRGALTTVQQMLLLHLASKGSTGPFLAKPSVLSPSGDCWRPHITGKYTLCLLNWMLTLLTKYLHNNYAGNWQTSRYLGLIKMTHTISLHTHRDIWSTTVLPNTAGVAAHKLSGCIFIHSLVKDPGVYIGVCCFIFKHLDVFYLSFLWDSFNSLASKIIS